MSSVRPAIKLASHSFGVVLLGVAAFFAIPFCAEVVGRFALWAFTDHFKPYLNHVDGPVIDQTNQQWRIALSAAGAAALISLASWKMIKIASWALFAITAASAVILWIMLAKHGLVSYEDFISHRGG